MVTSMQDFQSSFQSHLWALLLLHLLFLLCAVNLKNDRQASHFCFCLVSGQFHHQVLRMKLQSFTNSFGRGNIYYQGKPPSKRSLSLWQSKTFRFHTLTYPDPNPALLKLAQVSYHWILNIVINKRQTKNNYCQIKGTLFSFLFEIKRIFKLLTHLALNGKASLRAWGWFRYEGGKKKKPNTFCLGWSLHFYPK